MKRLNYTQMTLRYLRENGIECDKAEQFNPYAGKFGQKKDLFGFIDLVALPPGGGIIGVQSTSGGCHAEHKKKIVDSECTENVIRWLKAGGEVWLLSWSKKLLKRGGKAKRWFPRLEKITLDDIGK